MIIHSYSKRHIDAIIKEKEWSWRFTGIYGNSVRGLDYKTWALMNRLRDHIDMSWVLGGDFNEITDSSEKKGGLDRIELNMCSFRDTINVCGVMDPSYIGPKFTWCNKHVNKGIIWERLDCFLINHNLMS